MAKKKRFYFHYTHTATVIEGGFLAVDAYDEDDAHDELEEGNFSELLCSTRMYDDDEWTFNTVESPDDKTD